MLQSGSGQVRISEIMNFMIVGGAAWISYMRGIQAIKKESGITW